MSHSTGLPSGVTAIHDGDWDGNVTFKAEDGLSTDTVSVTDCLDVVLAVLDRRVISLVERDAPEAALERLQLLVSLRRFRPLVKQEVIP